jgi:hypothetical protein
LHYSAVELLGTLVLFFMLFPFLDDLRHGELIEVLLLTVLFVSAGFAVGTRRSTAWVAGSLMALALAAKWAEHLLAPTFPQWVFPPLALCFFGFVIMNLVLSTLRARQVDAQVLSAAIAAYLILGLLFTMAYILVGRLSPDAFFFATGAEGSRSMSRFNAFYFSFVTLSIVGYGDISPVSKVARMLAATEAMTGMIYMAVLIARLVSLYAAPNPQPPDQE